MVDIIAFPGPSSLTVDTSRVISPETTGDSLPQVGVTLDGTLVVAPAVPDGSFASGDWTNQELADLYRVEALLVQAGIPLSTARGVTDENDPWFVFCRDDGDVFVHLARADGRFLLDSPGLVGLLEGPDFPSLIDRFVQQLSSAQPAADDDGKVISFRPRMLRDKSVRLHPSVLLAALVWTLYLASDDIASATEAASDLATGAGHSADELLPADKTTSEDNSATTSDPTLKTDAADETTSYSSADQAIAQGAQSVNSQEAARSAHGQDNRAVGISGVFAGSSSAAQAVSASLAVIAFSFGFYGPQTTNRSNDDGASEALSGLQSALRQVAEGGSGSARLRGDGAPVLVQTDDGTVPVVLETLEAHAQLAATDVPDYELHLMAGSVDPVKGQDQIAEADVPVEAEAHSTVAVEPKASTPAAVVVEQSSEEVAQAPPNAPEEPEPGVLQKVEPVSETQSVMSLVLEQLESGAEYDLGGSVVSATLDLEALDKVVVQLEAVALEQGSAMKDPIVDADPLDTDVETKADDEIAVPEADQPDISVVGAQINQYSDAIERFMYNFIQSTKTIEIVHFQRELVIVDMSAIDDATDRAYARSWVTDEGHIISTVGHYSDFLDYGLA